MARLPQLLYEKAPEASRALWDEQVRDHGRMTNLKRTLAHSPEAMNGLMTFYPLFAVVVPFLGKRLAIVYTFAVSVESDCLVCSTYFRRLLKDSGENPDALTLDEREQTVVDYGRQLAKDSRRVPNELYSRLASYFEPRQIVALTSLGAMMIATNIVNNALEIELDDYLEPYRKLT